MLRKRTTPAEAGLSMMLPICVCSQLYSIRLRSVCVCVCVCVCVSLLTPHAPDYAPYKVSKIGVNRLAEIQSKTLATDPALSGLLVNAVSQPQLYDAAPVICVCLQVCPGRVRTRMGGASAQRSVEQGIFITTDI